MLLCNLPHSPINKITFFSLCFVSKCFLSNIHAHSYPNGWIREQLGVNILLIPYLACRPEQTVCMPNAEPPTFRLIDDLLYPQSHSNPSKVLGPFSRACWYKRSFVQIHLQKHQEKGGWRAGRPPHTTATFSL